MAKTATIAIRGARVAVRRQAFVAEVLRTRALSPSMMRVVLGGRGLLGFVSTGVGDEFVRLLFAAVGESEPRLPEAKDGVLDYGSIDPDLSRVYTVRRFDAERGEVTIDFALHSGVSPPRGRCAPSRVTGWASPHRRRCTLPPTTVEYDEQLTALGL